MNNRTIISLALGVVFAGWAFWLVSAKPSENTESVAVQSPAASIVNGTQIIDMRAKGGYSPRVIEAKAGVPTVLRVTTNGTFDCSASIVIPKLSYQKFLQPSGTESIEIPADEAQGTLQGTCAMGMYSFQIRFQ